MQKLFFMIFICFSGLVLADLSVEQIEEMTTKIHLKREGIKLSTLETTKEPFVVAERTSNVTVYKVPVIKQKEAVKLVLHALLNGRAYINDGWKSLDEVVMGYTVKFIGKRGVVLRNGNHVKKLLLHKEGESFIKLEERK